jgi:uncharacterized protein YbaR (Trm112 family)
LLDVSQALRFKEAPLPIQNDLLEILVDPVTKTPVQLLTQEQLTAINAGVVAKNIKNVEGKTVEEPLQEGLITTDSKTIFRIDNDIPIMLSEQAIPAEQVEGL